MKSLRLCPPRQSTSASLAALLALLLHVPAQALVAGTSVIAFDFDTPPSPSSTPVPPSLAAPGLGVSGFDALANLRNDFNGNGGNAFGANGDWTAAGLNRLFFAIDVAPGFALDLTGYGFDEQGSGGGSRGFGPTDWQLFVGPGATPAASGAATIGAFGTHAGALGFSGLTGRIDVVLLAFGAADNPAGAGNAHTGSWRIDNFILEGAVSAVPLPGALALFAGALPLLGAAGWRARRDRT